MRHLVVGAIFGVLFDLGIVALVLGPGLPRALAFTGWSISLIIVSSLKAFAP